MTIANRQIPESTPEDKSLSRDIVAALRYWISVLRFRLGTRGLIVLAAVVIGAGLALNWGWVVAIGLAPILLAVLPCAVMCALGLCMMPKGEKSCSQQSSADESERREIPPSRPTPPEAG